MADITLPTLNPPPAGASWQQELDYFRAQVAAAQARAQQATADALQASVSAQAALATAMGQPAPPSLPSRAELIFQCLMAMPQVTSQTDAEQVTKSAARVDAFLKSNPGAVR